MTVAPFPTAQALPAAGLAAARAVDEVAENEDRRRAGRPPPAPGPSRAAAAATGVGVWAGRGVEEVELMLKELNFLERSVVEKQI
jgi:hypothetical protein